MKWAPAILTLSIFVFCGTSAGAQESTLGIAPIRAVIVPVTATKLETDELTRAPLNVRFVPADISKDLPVTVLESFVDFSIKRDPRETARAWKLVPAHQPKERDVSDLRIVDDPDKLDRPKSEGFQWGLAIRQSLFFLAVQHGYAMTQPKTRTALRGPFFKDYVASVRSLSGWSDGGKFFTNYVAHPMQGSFVGFIQIHNDPRGMRQTFGKSGEYWKSRMKALAWSAAWSTQFEIGPISQASIGNVGHGGKQTYIDLVVTPTVGIGMLITEDILDKYVVRRIERWSGSFLLRAFARMIFNPTRSVANIVRFELPWHRDPGLRF